MMTHRSRCFRWDRQVTGSLVFLALTTVFGLQLIRLLLNGLVFYVRDAAGAPTYATGVYALGLFLLGFSAPLLSKFIPSHRGVLLVGISLGLIRLFEQFITLPIADLVLATLGTGVFLIFIPMYLGRVLGIRTRTGESLALGLLVGIAADTALKGAWATLDLSWQPGLFPVLLIGSLVVTQIASARTLTKDISKGYATIPILPSLTLVGLGAFLFLELLLFQNIGQQTVLSNVAQPQTLAWICLGNTLGVVAVIGLFRARWTPNVAGFALFGILLAGIVYAPFTGYNALIGSIAGHVILSILLALACASIGHPTRKRGLGGIAFGSSIGMLFLVLLMFTYYAGYDLLLPVSQTGVLMIAAGIIGLAGVGTARVIKNGLPKTQFSWAPAKLTILLLLLPLWNSIAWTEPSTAAGQGFPVRVMSYNLHQGFDTSGRLDMEALAQVIESESPDIIAFQEISRGWAIDGSFDMLPWLSQRLDMTYVWGPTADSVWGNAILSRFPIIESTTYPMPNNDQLLLKRGFTEALIDIGNGERIAVIGTHLHHTIDGADQRQSQLQALHNFVKGRSNLVLLGDLNAEPDHSEINLLRQAGLVDTYDQAGFGNPGITWDFPGDQRRIDYIWVSSDLIASDFSVIESRASDHYPLATTLSR